MDVDKPCQFCPAPASVWIWLDEGRGPLVRLCSRHNKEMLATLLDLNPDHAQCPECGTEIHLEEPDPEDVYDAQHVDEELDARGALLRHEVQWFAAHMAAKLKANDHKGGWIHESSSYFVKRLADEWRELAHVIDLATMHEASPQDIIDECADIANYAMMLADVVRREPNHADE